MRLSCLLLIAGLFPVFCQPTFPEGLWHSAQFRESGTGASPESVFRPGAKNILIIEGFNADSSDLSGMQTLATGACANVLTFSYPSGAGLGVSARLLYQQLAPMLSRSPDIRIDVIALGAGGLVARAAIEPSALNGGETIGRWVNSLITVGTPHTGVATSVNGRDLMTIMRLPAYVPGLSDMLAGSRFLAALNAKPEHGSTFYFAVAGESSNRNDGLVSVDSALGRGVLNGVQELTLAQTTYSSLARSPELYANITHWLLSNVPAPVPCANMSGVWTYTERGTETCLVEGETENQTVTASASFAISQIAGVCSFHLDITDSRVPGARLPRDATLSGNDLSLTGPVGVAVASDVTLGENAYTSSGRVCGKSATLTGSGKLTGTQKGVAFSCTYSSTADWRMTGSAAGPSLAVVSAASNGRGSISPESFVSAYGSGFAQGTTIATAPLPTTLGGVRVVVRDTGGAERDAPLYLVSPGQINFIAPSGLASGPAEVRVLRGERTVSSAPVDIQDVAPGIFTSNSSGQGQAAATTLTIAQDGVRTGQVLFEYNTSSRTIVPVEVHLGLEGQQVYLTLWGTGLRGRDKSSVSVTIGGEPVPVLFSGASQEFAGLDQVNVGPLPRTLSGRGVVPIVVMVDNRAANVSTMRFGQTLGLPPFIASSITDDAYLDGFRVVDITGDGKLDLFATKSTDALNFYVLPGRGDGTFEQRQQVKPPVFAPPLLAAVADLSGDGLPDIAFSRLDSEGQKIQVYFGDAQMAFSRSAVFLLPARSATIAVGDFDLDGTADLAAVLYSTGQIAILRGLGGGAFETPRLLNASLPGGLSGLMVVDDIDRDGRKDVVVAARGSGDVGLFFATANGSFSPQQTVAVAPGQVGGLAFGDVNGDGLPDLVAVYGREDVAVALARKGGGFEPGKRIGGADTTTADFVAVADLNGDGLADIITRNVVMMGTGGGAFQNPIRVVPDSFVIAVCDVNGDGKTDLVVQPYRISGTVRVLLGTR